jgi:putative transcriptional regulator
MPMIRFRLAELIADAQFKSGHRIKLVDIAQATGINRMTLSRMSNVRGYSTSTDTIDKLCKYFSCQIGDVAQYVDEVPDAPVVPAKTVKSKAIEPDLAPKERQTSKRRGPLK